MRGFTRIGPTSNSGGTCESEYEQSHLGREPRSGSGSPQYLERVPVATLSIATSRQWKNQAGEKQEKTEWHRVVFWNTKFSTLADIAERYCKKGDKVYVEGSIEYRSWQDREGQTRYTTEINGRELILLSGKGDGGETFSLRARSRRVRPHPKARSRSTTSPRRSTPRTTTCRSKPAA